MISPWMLHVARDLGATQGRVWWTLCAYAWEPTVLPLATIAAESGTERRAVLAALAELEAAGHIHRTQNPGYPSMMCIVNQSIPKLGPVVQEITGTRGAGDHGSEIPMVENTTTGSRARDLYDATHTRQEQEQPAPVVGSRARRSQNQDQDQDQNQSQKQPQGQTQSQNPNYSQSAENPRFGDGDFSLDLGCREVVLDVPAAQITSGPKDNSPAAQETFPGITDAITHLHQLWQHVVNKPGWGLTKSRRATWTKVLKDAGSVERAAAAVRGLGRSEFHMGGGEDGRLWVEPEYILRNLDAWADATLDAAQGALVAPDPTRGQTWDVVRNELLERFQRARDDLMRAIVAAIKGNALEPMTTAELAGFHPRVLPLGKFVFEGRTATVFPDGPTGAGYLMFIHSANATAALIAGDEMVAAYPVSVPMRMLADQFAHACRQERLLQYAKTVRDFGMAALNRYPDSEIVDYDPLTGIAGGTP